jgi:hypothetical protein
LRVLEKKIRLDDLYVKIVIQAEKVINGDYVVAIDVFKGGIMLPSRPPKIYFGDSQTLPP